jgi:aquaporin Z
MLDAIKNHWREYLMEAWGLGTFMISACVFGVVLFHPASPGTSLNSALHNAPMGAAMGATAIGIFCSPWGKRSGAHINPAVTFAFWRLGKIKNWDAAFYILAQFAGGAAGVFVSWLLLGAALENSAVNFVATVPGAYGAGAAFAAEAVISFLMMMMVLTTLNSAKWSRFTPFFAGTLVAFYITFENPLSGMSMNPARTFGSAIWGNVWTGWWIYFVAPPLAMLAAAEVYVRARGLKSVLCAKFHHHNTARCIFNCRFGEIAKKEDFIEVTNQKAMFPPAVGLF